MTNLFERRSCRVVRSTFLSFVFIFLLLVFSAASMAFLLGIYYSENMFVRNLFGILLLKMSMYSSSMPVTIKCEECVAISVTCWTLLWKVCLWRLFIFTKVPIKQDYIISSLTFSY